MMVEVLVAAVAEGETLPRQARYGATLTCISFNCTQFGLDRFGLSGDMKFGVRARLAARGTEAGNASSRRSRGRDATKTSTIWRNTDLYFFRLHSIRAGSIWIERRYEVWSSSTTCCARHRSRECQ